MIKCKKYYIKILMKILLLDLIEILNSANLFNKSLNTNGA